MIIDCHVHLIGINEINGCFVSPRMTSGLVYHLLSRVLGLHGTSREELDHAYREKLVEWVHGCEVDAIGVLGLDGIYNRMGELDRKRTQVYVSNDYVLDVCKISDQLLPICSINPKRRDAMDELERCSEAGTVAIKWLPNSQDFDPADDKFRPFYRRMVELGLPLLTHTSFEHTIPPVNQKWGKPERLRTPLSEGVTVIAAHCSSAGVAHVFREDFGTWLQMLHGWPRLFGDISALASVSRFPYIHKVLADELATERVILGSDFPVPVSPMVFAPKIGVKKATELAKIENPIQRNLETFRAVGVPESVMHRSAEILRVPVGR